MDQAIEVAGLTKTYVTDKGRPPLVAVAGIDFAVREGEVFGFLGPNGAGKTTTIRMLTGLARPTSGGARVMGLDLAADLPRIKKQIGVVPEASNLYDELTALDNLIFAMQLYGVPRANAGRAPRRCWPGFGWARSATRSFAKLSRGMKRALTIAAGLAHRPPLLFLDEPTTGLDVMSARNLRADDRRPARRGRDHLPDHPLPGGGRAALRSHRDHRQRSHRGAGHRGWPEGGGAGPDCGRGDVCRRGRRRGHAADRDRRRGGGRAAQRWPRPATGACWPSTRCAPRWRTFLSVSPAWAPRPCWPRRAGRDCPEL